MKESRWWMCFCTGLLALACAVSMTACSDGDDDDDDAAGVVVVTNVVNGTTVVVTNAAPQALVAPQLVSPADGTEYSAIVILEPGFNVDFEWTAVPGAASYVLELDGTQHAVAGTTATLPVPDFGAHKWRVWAKDGNGASGPASAKDGFTIKFVLLTPI